MRTRDEVKADMGYLMLEEISMPIGMPEKIVKKLLSIPELAVVDREAKPLKKGYSDIPNMDILRGYELATKEMLETDWVREVKW